MSPSVVLDLDGPSAYVAFREKAAVCPSSKKYYPPFSVLHGPVCPGEHKFAPGVERPFRAHTEDRKLAGLYRAFGFTNLIEEAEQQTQPDNP
ncbi:hypothetical protein ACFLQU_04490 [Verrucomicrobiota bacterium]